MPVATRSTRPRVGRPWGAGSLVVLLSLTSAACAHSRAPVESEAIDADRQTEVAQLRRENAALRTRVQNLEERVRMLEQGGSLAWGESEGEGEWSSASMEVPTDTGEVEEVGPRKLPVVKLQPKNGGKISAGPAKGAPPPVEVSVRPSGSISLSNVPNSGAPEYDEAIDAYGDDSGTWNGESYDADAGTGETASYRLVGSKLVEATQRKPATVTGKKDRDSGVAGDYERAMDTYRAGKYADAEAAFEEIVRDHPNHDYADNALYWQGEAAYDQAHYADALEAFTAVVERYGGGGKAPDALLKIGLCYGRLGDTANARDVLTQLVAAYPRSEASKIAKRKLAELED